MFDKNFFLKISSRFTRVLVPDDTAGAQHQRSEPGNYFKPWRRMFMVENIVMILVLLLLNYFVSFDGGSKGEDFVYWFQPRRSFTNNI